MQPSRFDHEESKENGPPFRVRLPGFLVAEDIGLGDLIKRATATLGVTACCGCERRATTLNRRVVFASRRPLKK